MSHEIGPSDSGRIIQLPQVGGFGKTSKRVDVEGFILEETKHQPSLSLPKHSHECASILFTIKGSFTETVKGRVQICRPHSLLMRPAGEVHTNRYGGDGAECLIIGVKKQRLEATHPMSNVFDRVRYIQGGLLPILALRIHKEFRLMDSASALAIEGLTLELLAQTARRSNEAAQRKPPRWLERAREFVQDRFAEGLTLACIAESESVHPVYLSRMFHRHYRQTIGEYIRQLRIEYACRELTATETPLVEIALAAGFCSQSHLSTAFKRHTGLTPAEYRAASRSS